MQAQQDNGFSLGVFVLYSHGSNKEWRMNQRRRKKMSEAVGDSGRVIGLLNIEGRDNILVVYKQIIDEDQGYVFF